MARILLTLFLVASGSEIEVVSNDVAFALVNFATGLADCWGDSRFGGDCAAVNFQNVTKAAAQGLFGGDWHVNRRVSCVFRRFFHVLPWVFDEFGARQVHANTRAMAALSGTGGTCWGSSSFGGSCSSVNLAGMTQLYSTDFSHPAAAFGRI